MPDPRVAVYLGYALIAVGAVAAAFALVGVSLLGAAWLAVLALALALLVVGALVAFTARRFSGVTRARGP